jgi:hypothetical protein
VEAVPVRDPRAMTPQRTRVRPMHRQPRDHGLPHSIDYPRRQREHAGHLDRFVVIGTAPVMIDGPPPRPVDPSHFLFTG